MASSDVRPYLTPSQDTIVWEPWQLRDGDEWTALPEFVEGWDPGTDLELRRVLRVDLVHFRTETLTDATYFAVNVSWRSSTTGMVESAPTVAIPDSGIGEVNATLSGARLGGTLTIRSTVVLAKSPDVALPGTVQVPGSVVAEDQCELILERGMPMFPVNMVDFARTRYPPSASWHLETGGDLDAPFLGSFMLMVNSRDNELCAAIARGPKDKISQALYDELESAVAALMIELAIYERDQLVEGVWPTDSVGDVLQRTLGRSGLADAVAPSAFDLADFRTQLAGAVRSMGHGRVFR